jgi:hypothetical protein
MNSSNSLKPKGVLALILTIALLSTCKKKKEEEKQPTASFSTDKTEYLAGETIILTNTSTDAKTYRWTMPDGQTVKSKDASYTTDPAGGDESLQFKLEAISESGNKSDYEVKNVNLKRGTAWLVLSKQLGYAYYSISIDGAPVQTIFVSGEKTNPSCYESGYVTFQLKSGFHAIGGFAGSSTPLATATFVIAPNVCFPYVLH